MSSSPSTAPSRACRLVEGVEVPIPGCDNLTWIDLIVPASPTASAPPPPPTQSRASVRPRSTGSCHVFSGDPPAYVIWRVHDDQPNVLEIIEVFPSKEFPEKGLRLFFPDDIFPFSFICKNKVRSSSTSIYMIYALTVSGVAYLFKLKSFYAHTSASIFPGSDIDALNVQNHSQITSVGATFGCLMIGREDGSVSCYHLGAVDESSPGFTLEFRDDVGIGRLWNLMSRARIVAAVLDLAVHEIFGRKFLFVVHIDGSLRIWDILSNTKIFNHSINVHETAGSLSRFWVSNANYDTSQFLLAVQFEGHSDSNFGMIAVYCLNFNEEKLTLLLDSSVKYIPLDEGRLVDMKLTHDKLWLLKEEGPLLYNLSYSDINMEGECTYNLHEEFIADKLFQGSEHLSDDLLWTGLSAFSSTKDQIPYVISLIFLRRLLQPGIFLNSALHATICDLKGYRTDHEVQSRTISALKQELLSIIESKGVATNLRSIVYYWKEFSSHFFHHWCQNNGPYSLFIDSLSGAIGLIRKGSISLFRKLEAIEMVMDGSYDELCDIRQSGLILPGDDLDCDILFDILRSMRTVGHQLGRASSVFYECLANPSIVSYEDTVFHLLKFLEAGYSSSMSASFSLAVGDDATWAIKQTDHRNHRKFSIDMYLSFMGLHSKATSWSRVLDITEIYLKNFLPDKLSMHTGSKLLFSVNSSLLVQATSQVSGAMFDCAFNMYMLLGYLANVNVQVQMAQVDLSRIRLKIMPMMENIIMYWYILHFISTTQSEAYILEDFSSRLSSLHIDKHADNRPLDGALGTSGLTLASLLSFPFFPNEDGFVTSMSFLDPSKFVDPVWNFCRWAIWGKTDHEPNVLWRSLQIACIFLQNGQYEAAENLLAVIDAHISKNKCLQNIVGDYGACLHLLGYCLVVRGHDALNAVLKEWKIREAVRCFFRVATSGEETFVSLQNLSFQTGFHCPGNSGSAIVWKFFYHQWVMQFFEQYNLSEAACHFALSALEQVDEVLGDESSGPDTLLEPVDVVKGKLWANVFKFSVDLGYYGDAYCAVISNPDEDSKLICLRRFIIVLYEQGESKILCNGEFPFVGLVEKVEQELLWKAERSDIFSRPNLYRLLYAFQMHRNNWGKAATYMYHYSNRLKQEMIAKENLQDSLLEILHALSASINALQLVHSPHAWIDFQHKNYLHPDKSSPNKRPRYGFNENSSLTVDPESQSSHCYTDIETLEKEYALLSAQYLLSTMNIKHNINGNEAHIFTTVDALIEANLYDMAFTLLLKFCKGSKLKGELERVFVAISQKCFVSNGNSFLVGSHMARDLRLISDGGNFDFNGKAEAGPVVLQPLGYSLWELLEAYLEKYKMLHPRLPVNVAETLLCSDPHIELPVWLVHMFKGGRRSKSCGMAGNEYELDPATLFRLYVDYGRYGEATNLLLEYLEAFASMRPADIINRKKMSAVCFPHVAIERLWCHLEEVQNSGHMVDQCVRLKNLLCGTLQNHLKQVKIDSDDALASAAV